MFILSLSGIDFLHPYVIFLSVVVNIFSLAFLFGCILKIFYVWKTLKVKRYLYLTIGFSLMFIGIIIETIFLTNILLIPKGEIRRLAKLLLTGLLWEKPSFLFFLASYLILLYSYATTEKNRIKDLFTIIPLSFIWIGIQSISALISALIGIFSYRNKANLLTTISFFLLSLSHIIAFQSSPRFILTSSVIRSLALLTLVLGCGVISIASKKE